jgi:hypothetical protein
MQPPPDAIQIEEVEWDEHNEAHAARHDITPWLVDDILDGRPLFFPNLPGRSGTHKMIGPSREGRFWTVIIVEVAEGRWRPITGWPSDKPEVELYKAGTSGEEVGSES